MQQSKSEILQNLHQLTFCFCQFAPLYFLIWGILTRLVFILTTQASILFWDVMSLKKLARRLLYMIPSRGKELHKSSINIPGRNRANHFMIPHKNPSTHITVPSPARLKKLKKARVHLGLFFCFSDSGPWRQKDSTDPIWP